MTHRIAKLALAAVLLSSSIATAHAQVDAGIPPALAPWVPWVLAGESDYGCTSPRAATDGDRSRDPICVWPGELRIEVLEGGASFVLQGESDRETVFSLPGSDRIQPIDVTLDGRPAVVLTEGGRAQVRVGAGAHRIEGRLSWTTRPETLRVPDEVARVLLIEDGTTSVAARGTSGEVWLAARASEAVGEDRVTLEVHRRLDDGSPVTLTTRIQVRAAGRARELSLGDVLPEGAVPVEVSADLPVRMLPGGELTMQLHAGEFTVTVTALVADPETAYRRPALPAPWPAQEVWVWVPSESFRQVDLSGADGIDPARTSLPAEWRSYSAYLLGEENVLTLSTSRRGEPTPPPNELTVARTVWLDVSGGGYTARDTLSAAMHSVHRLELLEGELGRVSFIGEDQLITVGEEGRPGIELRATSASLTAEWRAETSASSLPAVGWSEDAQSSSTTLNLPPGWELVHASGVDRAPGTWMDRWSLLGFFALLIISAAVGQVMGWRFGALALLGVGLSFHSDGAPQWIWLLLALLLALHRVLARRGLEPFIRWSYLGVMLIAVVMGVVFSAYQTKYALYPQLAPTVGYGSSGWADDDWGGMAMGSAAPEAMEEPPMDWDESEGGFGRRSSRASDYGVLGSLSDGLSREAAGYGSNSVWLDPNAVVQTGFGVPTWSWSSYELSFDGPVARDHHIDLVLSPPWMTRLFSLLRAVLVLLLLGVVVFLRPQAPPASDAPDDSKDPGAGTGAGAGTTGAGSGAGAGSTGAAVVLAALTLFGVASPARAQEIPSSEILNELRERLTRDPVCERCADANHLTVRIDDDTLVIEMEISASETSAYPLPGPTTAWTPESVSLDGRPSNAVIRLSSGFLHARVPAGVHTLRVTGPLGGRDSMTLAFGRAPRSLSVTAEGWEVDGLSAETGAPESIQLRRLLTTAGPEASLRSELPTWLEVERRLDIGVRWTLTSVVRRRSPATAPAVARIPLLPGESVTDSGITVEGGQALVTLGQNATEARWTSTLEPTESVVLTAPDTGRLSEVWVLACSALWHCESEGIAPTESASGVSWEPRFHPWPGESLTLRMTRPRAAEGQSVTIDRASLTVRPGVRLTTSSLALTVRTSVSSPLRVTVPSGADVRSLTVSGSTRPLQREGDEVVIALQPGAHEIAIEWQETRGWEAAYATPRVEVDHALVNAELVVEGSGDRWLLWIAGPAWGPAVLFWPYLIVILAVAFALARRRELPLSALDWCLLLIGLTQIPALAALIVVGWFFALEHRRTSALASAALFDLRQLVIVGYTFIAFALLIWAVQAGLLGDPEMGIEGPESWGTHLRFFVDRSDGAMPTATLFSVPTEVFRVAMFSWALWLTIRLVRRWALWGWTAFAHDGLFRPLGVGAPSPADPIETKGEPAAVVVADGDRLIVVAPTQAPDSPAAPETPASETSPAEDDVTKTPSDDEA